MSESLPEKQKNLAVQIASNATDSEKAALRSWIEAMIKLRDSDASALVKIQKSIEMTATSDALPRAIKRIGQELTPAALTELMGGLSEISESNLPTAEKLNRATSLVWEKSKLIAWGDRGLATRVGMIAAIAGIVTFGSQGAGIAALGGAIGVPLWVVFGAGGAFLALLYQEITGKEISEETMATYRVIDAEKEEEEIRGKLARSLSPQAEKEIRRALERSWSSKTSVCYNPSIAPVSYGQCSPTAVVVYELFGGEILRTDISKHDGTTIRHFYNRINGQRHDFTRDQFDITGYWGPVVYKDIPSSVEEALTEMLPGQLEAMRAAFEKALRGEDAD